MAPRLEEALKILPANRVEEVAEFAERLANQYRQQSAPARLPKISWAGAAKALQSTYTSGVDMAHEAQRMRGILSNGESRP